MKTSFFHFVVGVSILALVTMACGLTVPGVNAPTEAPNVPPTQPSLGGGGNDNGPGLDNNGNSNNDNGAVKPPSSRPLFQDDFRGRDTHWGTGTDSDTSVEYVNDALQFQIFSPNYFLYSTPGDDEYTNIHIEVTVANSSADPNAAFGVMCYQQFMDDEYYYAYITPNGDYGIVMSPFIEDDVDLVTGTSDLIPQNASSYQIGFDCGNGVLTLYVNGQQIDTVADVTYTSGHIGLIAWAGDVASGLNVSFDDIIVTALP
jgi:hypothetical protein